MQVQDLTFTYHRVHNQEEFMAHIQWPENMQFYPDGMVPNTKGGEPSRMTMYKQIMNRKVKRKAMKTEVVKKRVNKQKLKVKIEVVVCCTPKFGFFCF